MDRFNVFGIGELLWDELPEGRRPGGAPANFAYVATQLGDNGAILSRVGGNDDGGRLVASIAATGVNTTFIQTDDQKPTGTVSVELKQGQPQYVIHEPVAWDELAFSGSWEEAAGIADALSFGTLGQRSPRSKLAIRSFLGTTRAKCLKLLDLNLRQTFYSAKLIDESLGLANALKLNGSELDVLSRQFGIAGGTADALDSIRRRFDLKLACLTRGEDPSLLATRDGLFEASVGPVIIADAVGAGDAFAAGLVHGVLRSWEPEKTLRFAGRVGSYVASMAGAMPDFSHFKSDTCADQVVDQQQN